MDLLKDQLDNEITWRTDELSIIKTLPYLHAFSEKQKTVFQKYSIPAIYSLWEGFVVSSISIYIREINKLNINPHELDINILVHDIDCKLNLNNPRVHFEKKITFVNTFIEHIKSSNISISSTLPTESNVNYKVICKILTRVNLPALAEDVFQKKLDKLLRIRNHFAHGENSITVDDKLIAELIELVIHLMHEICNIILDGYNNRLFLRIMPKL
ncbi:MAG TPA: hypothetical protein DCM73_14955 [Clostridiales bacterium]|nr:hypothetical protein [Clostridiales bacterium]